ncbi:MAG: preprotein translocase subunit YajC [Pseudonocardiales bacterium]
MTTASALIVAAGSSKGAGLTPLLLLLALFAFTYLILIRPQRARAKALQQTQATLARGAEVMTTAGLYATVVEIGDDTVTLETSPGVHQRYARAAVARVVSPAAGDDDTAEDSTDGTGDDSPDDASTVER